MKYARLERLDIGRQVYYNELTAQEAGEKYELSALTVMHYARLFRDEHGLPRKPPAPKKPSVVLPKVRASASKEPSLQDYKAMSKEELIHELIEARITEARLKKGYTVKGVGPEKEFVPLDNKSIK